MRQPNRKIRLRHFLPAHEKMDRNPRSLIIPHRNRHGLHRNFQVRAHLVQIAPIEKRHAQFRRPFPIRSPQSIKRAQRILRPGLDDHRRHIAPRRLSDGDQMHHLIVSLPHFIQIHLILMAIEIRNVGIRIKLIIHLKKIPQRRLRVHRGPKMPSLPTKKIPPLHYRRLHRCRVRKRRPLQPVIQYLARAKRHRRLRTRTHSVCICAGKRGRNTVQKTTGHQNQPASERQQSNPSPSSARNTLIHKKPL